MGIEGKIDLIPDFMRLPFSQALFVWQRFLALTRDPFSFALFPVLRPRT